VDMLHHTGRMELNRGGYEMAVQYLRQALQANYNVMGRYHISCAGIVQDLTKALMLNLDFNAAEKVVMEMPAMNEQLNTLHTVLLGQVYCHEKRNRMSKGVSLQVGVTTDPSWRDPMLSTRVQNDFSHVV